MQEWWLKVKEWWTHLAPREKQAIAAGGVLLGLFIIYQGIWSPFMNHVASMRSSIKTNQKVLAFMQAADKEMQKNQGQSKTKNKAVSPVILLSILQKHINRMGAEQQLTQLKQAGNNSVEMHFQKIEFDKLMSLLINVIKEQNVSIAQMSVIADSTLGIVNADVTLKL